MPHRLAEVLPPDAHLYLEGDMACVIRSEFIECDVTPLLGSVLKRSRNQYLRLTRHLLRVGLVSIPPAGSAFERCGSFLVRKLGKDTSRLIIDNDAPIIASKCSRSCTFARERHASASGWSCRMV